MKTFIKFIFVISLIILIQNSYAQVGINATGAAPAANAMLDVSSTTKGLLMPRMTTIQRNTLTAIATDGLTVYDTDTKSYWYYRSLPVGWVEVSTGGVSPWAISGNNIRNTNTGNVGINTVSPLYALHVTANNQYGIYSTATETGIEQVAGVYGKAISPTPVPYSAGVRGESTSTNYNGIGVIGIHSGSGWGVAGFIKEEGASGVGYAAGVFGASGYPVTGGGTGGFGVYGFNNNTGGIAGYFNNNNISGNSKALKTDGKIQFAGIGEAVGKVLTSDASGNATWSNLPANANTWAVSGADISNTNTGNVGIGTVAPTAKLMIENTGAVSANSSSTDSFLRLKLTNDNYFGWMRYENSSGTRHFSQKFHLYSPSASDNSYSLYYGLDQLFNIKGDGRFGLNVANPADLLHLSPISATGDVYTRISSTTGLTGLRLQNNAGDWAMYSNEFSKLFLGYSANNFVSTAEVITIEPTGADFNFLPSTNNQVNLGTAGSRWKTLNTNRLDVAGFSKLGDDPATPSIKMKKLTVTNGAAGITSSFAHSLSQSKILSVSVFINANTGNDIAPRSTYPGFEYDMYVSSTSVVIRNIVGNDAGIAGRPVRILITYEE
jgi:hypothetical protein